MLGLQSVYQMSRKEREVVSPERAKLREYVSVRRVHLWGMVGYVPITKLKKNISRKPKLIETKLYSRNPIKGINTWAFSLVIYSGPFLKWNREELKQMNQRTRKLMTMHKTLHPRDDVDRLYVLRKEGGIGFTSFEDSVDASILRLEDYIEKRRGGLITATRNNTDNTRGNRTGIVRKNGNKNNSIEILSD